MSSRNHYGSRAALTYRYLIDPLLGPLRGRIATLCERLGGQSVLDIASGTGAQCRAMGKAGFDAKGIDLAKGMVDVARSMGGVNTSYVEGSGLALPFGDESFELCLLVLALHEHPERERAAMVAEAMRVLQPNGHLVVAEYQEPRDHRKLRSAWQLIRAIEHVAGDEHRDGFRDFIARGSLMGLLNRYGLKPISSVNSHFAMIRAVAVPKPEEHRATPEALVSGNVMSRS